MTTDALQPYLRAFDEGSPSFLTFHPAAGPPCRLSRPAFAAAAGQVTALLDRRGLVRGDRVLFCPGENCPEDLIWRMATAARGLVPVTVNWQADDVERLRYKGEKASVRLACIHEATPPLLRTGLSALAVPVVNWDETATEREASPGLAGSAGLDDGKMVIFTSGTTGQPKGVLLSFRAYAANAAAFDQVFARDRQDPFTVLLVNPLHHANSTAVSDWAMRRPQSQIHLFAKYSRAYWLALPAIVARAKGPVIAPLVSRHFDFFEQLCNEGAFGQELNAILAAMRRVIFLLGSAPVGPQTVQRLVRYSGRAPMVRFGSTETCLQVTATPVPAADAAIPPHFERGWQHRWQDESLPGYWIGSPHVPHTQVRVVLSVDARSPLYMQDCGEGQPGYLITKGENLMQGYLGEEEATRQVFEDGWYLGLRDICFFLKLDGRHHFFWVTRDSALLIKGGANYAYAQIEAELAGRISQSYQLAPSWFALAVVGLRLQSEHEDSCCLLVEVLDQQADTLQREGVDAFINTIRPGFKQAYCPDFVQFGPIPRNFKGAVELEKVKALFQSG